MMTFTYVVSVQFHTNESTNFLRCDSLVFTHSLVIPTVFVEYLIIHRQLQPLLGMSLCILYINPLLKTNIKAKNVTKY